MLPYPKPKDDCSPKEYDWCSQIAMYAVTRLTDGQLEQKKR